MRLDPLIGRPNPELKQITPTQVILLTFIVVGIVILIGSLFYLLTLVG